MVRRTALLFAFLAVTPALAGPRDDVYASSLRCAALTDDRSWLECYYGAAQPMRGQLQLPPAPAAQTSLIPPVNEASVARQQAVQQALHPVAPVPQKPGPIGRTLDYLAGGEAIITNAPLKSYEAGRQGQSGFTVVLANGQVWKQSDDQVRLVRWRNAPEAQRITIHKGALNSFNLNFDEEPDGYKVRRIK